MKEVYFKNDNEGTTPIPKAMWWYCIEKKYKCPLNADFCNKLLNNELKEFFEKYPEELTKSVKLMNPFSWGTNITEEDIRFYKSEIEV